MKKLLKLLYILISTSNLLLLGSKRDVELEYSKNTCNRTYWNPSLSTDEERAEYEECRYSRFEAYDKIAKKYVAHIVYNPSECYISHLLVDNKYQKQGIGRDLAEKALEDLRKHGCKDIELISSDDGRGFWEKLGAKPIPNSFRHVFSNLSSNLPKENSENFSVKKADIFG